METLISIIVALLFLSLIVLVHELGHFIVAILSKVKVEIFSIGFGPRIWGFKAGDVDFRISAIPLGGYVKMKGDNPSDANTEDPNSFYGTNPYKRALIALAGPLGNYLLAVIISSIILFTGYTIIGIKPQIYIEKSKGVNYFSLAGLQTGDVIKKINGKEIKTYQQIESTLVYLMDQNVEVIFERSGKEMTNRVYIPKNFINLEGGLGISMFIPPIIGNTIKGSPAEEVGLRSNDVILKINNTKVSSFNQASEIIRENGKNKIKITVLREGKEMTFDVQPKFDEKNKRFYIGIVPKVPEEMTIIIEEKESNILSAFVKGFGFANQKLVEVINGMKLLFTGKIDFQSSVAGPIRIVYYMSNFIQSKIALQNLMILVAVISMAIGIFNLIPFPGLDGWHIVISGVEAVTRKKPSPEAIGIIETIGFIAIVLLSIFIIFNDIFNIIFRDLKLFR